LTIVIQCINFGILLWLLKKLLFGPVTRLLDKRAADIKQFNAEAEGNRGKAASLVRDADERLADARKEALDIVAASRTEGFRQLEQILDRAREEAEAVQKKTRAEMEREARRAKEDLRRSTVGLSLRVAEKIIRKNLSGDDQERLAQRFIDEMEKKV
jgi:F-type H+-transporting ATPase subunit b